MDFDDIRPYRDEEVQTKIKQLMQVPLFMEVMQKMMPSLEHGQIQAVLSEVRSIKALQEGIIIPLLDGLIKKTIDEVQFSGLERLQKNQAYLFVSTHRDIVMDSALMNYVLLSQGYETAEIAIGDNLMTIPWVVDVVKLNKTFIVKRNVAKEQRLEESYKLSAYIRETVIQRNQSVWIAQRSGRSKDGNDVTNPGLVKMFQLSGEKSAFEDIKALNICPLSIAYEYNPCDTLFLPELIARSQELEYKKANGEDVMHMAKGIQGFKGKVSIDFGRPLNQEIDQFKHIKNKNDFFAELANWIDQEIYASYALKESNLAAYQLLHGQGKSEFILHEEQMKTFENYLKRQLKDLPGDFNQNRKLLLEMYASVVANKLNTQD